MSKRLKNGFTVIEIIFTILIIGFASIMFFIQKDNIQTVANDDKKKIAINAMYYSLENVFYAKNKYYPQTISSSVLTSMDPNLFTDPYGNEFGTSTSAYTYSPTNCENNKCKSYTLKARLENEADYVKTSLNN